MKEQKTIDEIIAMLRQRMQNHIEKCWHSECMHVECHKIGHFPYICYKEGLFFDDKETVSGRTHCPIGRGLNEVMVHLEKYHKQGGAMVTVSICPVGCN